MGSEFKMRSTDNFWSFRVDIGVNSTVFFGNPKVNTNVIYKIEELKSILDRSDAENAFIPMPRSVMQKALNEYDLNSTNCNGPKGLQEKQWAGRVGPHL